MDEAVKLYLLWLHEWEANNLLGIFQNIQDAERWRNYFLATAAGEEESDDFYLSDMAHFAKNGELEGRLKIQEFTLDTLNRLLKVDNLKLLEWEAHKDEKANT